MIDPHLRAKDRIFSELPEDLKELMRQHILSEQDHSRVLQTIMEDSYRGKRRVEYPEFTFVVGQTGSGKSNLTTKLYKEDDNRVLIDSDKYKAYRPDNEMIMRNHLVEYAFLTGPDAYLHRDELVVDAISKRYNILMECAPSQKEGLFVDIEPLIRAGYRVRICTLAVSQINSLLSIHERYEASMLLNQKVSKLTGIARHDDSFSSLRGIIGQMQENPNVTIEIYQRGREYPFMPELIYGSGEETKRFSCALEALIHTQNEDERLTRANFAKRYMVLTQQMQNRNAPEAQIRQLEQVHSLFEKRAERENQE